MNKALFQEGIVAMATAVAMTMGLCLLCIYVKHVQGG
jgi:hypothetical protein